MRVLAVNAGSTSLKLEIYDFPLPVAAIAQPPPALTASTVGPAQAEPALARALQTPIDVVAHRFVRLPDGAPAVLRLDAGTQTRIAAAGVDAPLHDASALRAVATIAKLRPDLAQLAVSDSAFHRTMPPAATTYALPMNLTRLGLRRLGYHGLSHEYAAARACALAGIASGRSRVVTAHLGGGSSLCAVRDGTSIDTTMGYTPLEGLPMATRSGSVDPGLLIHLLRGGMSLDDLEQTLEHQSGLLGISGRSGDVRDLLAAPDDVAAGLAIDVLTWRLRSSFGALTAVLGGVDLIAFTGGIGEHSAAIRAAGLDGGLGLGLRLDDDRNATVSEGPIHAHDSPVAVWVVPAREGWQLARAAAAFTA